MSASIEKLVLPMDAHNVALLSHVHPPNYVNPLPQGKYNLVVIGGGTAGLVTAAGAAALGAKVALVEKYLLGGDCLNVGCVPSKALIRAARAVHEVRHAQEFGISVPAFSIEFSAVMERMRKLRGHIAPVDGVKSLTEKGVDVFLGDAKFVDSSTIEIGDLKLNFARAVIATGTRAALPSIPGLAELGPLTNETLFNLTELPRRLAVIGAGPIGVELAQCFARFGSEVTLYESRRRVLPAEEPEASALLHNSLERDGVRIRLNVKSMRCSIESGEKAIDCYAAETHHTDHFDHVLVAAGRAANVEGMNLDKVNVAFDRDGIHVNDRLRTTNSRIFACGDVATKYKFTHAADALARTVIGNALFFSNASASGLNIPWATYTDPEIAHVGVYSHAEEGADYPTIHFDLAHQDRAILDGADQGFIKISHDKRGNIKGATIVSAHAGELIGEIVVAMNNRVSLGNLATAVHPYPTQSEMIKKCGDLYRRTLLTPAAVRLLKKILDWRRS